jgi:hypothetical protein
MNKSKYHKSLSILLVLNLCLLLTMLLFFLFRNKNHSIGAGLKVLGRTINVV